MIENSHLPISEMIHLAWSKVKGSKGNIWVALLISFLIMFGLSILNGIIKAVIPSIQALIAFLVQIIGFLLQMGILFIGIRRAQNVPISYFLMFRTFESNIIVRIIGLYILQILILMIPVALMLFGFLFFGLQGTGNILIIALLLGALGLCITVYLGVRIMLAMALVLDKGINPWSAIIQSFHATKGNFWGLIALIILQSLIIVISAIPLGIGLIWTLPFAYILYGEIYKRLGRDQNIENIKEKPELT